MSKAASKAAKKKKVVEVLVSESEDSESSDEDLAEKARKQKQSYQPANYDSGSDEDDSSSSSDEENEPNKALVPVNGAAKGEYILDIDEVYKERPCLSLFVGRSKSGKSHFIKYLLMHLVYELRLFKFGAVFTGSAYNHDYDYIDPKFVFHSFDEEKHEQYIQKLKDRKEEKGDDMEQNFIVYDDLLGTLSRSKSMDNWFATYRQCHTHIFLTSQYLQNSTSSTLVRTQTQLLYAWQDRTKKTRNALYEWFGQLFDSQEEFEAFYERATNEKFRALVYCEGNPTKEESYTSIKAPKELPKVILRFGIKEIEKDLGSAQKEEESKKQQEKQQKSQGKPITQADMDKAKDRQMLKAALGRLKV